MSDLQTLSSQFFGLITHGTVRCPTEFPHHHTHSVIHPYFPRNPSPQTNILRLFSDHNTTSRHPDFLHIQAPNRLVRVWALDRPLQACNWGPGKSWKWYSIISLTRKKVTTHVSCRKSGSRVRPECHHHPLSHTFSALSESFGPLS